MVHYTIKLLNVEDYFFVVGIGSGFNTSGKLELHTLNSESYIATGTASSLYYIFQYWLGGIR